MSSDATMRAWRAEGQRDELLAKYVAALEALNEADARYLFHSGGPHAYASDCAKCGADAVIEAVREAFASAVPDVRPPVPRTCSR